MMKHNKVKFITISIILLLISCFIIVSIKYKQQNIQLPNNNEFNDIQTNEENTVESENILTKEEIIDSSNIDEINKSLNRTYNESEEIKKEKEIDGIIIYNLRISCEKDALCVVTGDVKNSSSQDIKEKYIKLSILYDTKEFSSILYYQELKIGESSIIEIQTKNFDIINASSYILSRATEEEINNYKSKIR